MGEPVLTFVEVVDDAPVPTVRVGGELDSEVARTLRDHLDRAIAAASGDVLVDMAGVTFLDSTAVGELVRAHMALYQVGQSLVVADATPVVTRVFEISGLLDSFPTWGDQHDRNGESQQNGSLRTHAPVSVDAEPQPSVRASKSRRPPPPLSAGVAGICGRIAPS